MKKFMVYTRDKADMVAVRQKTRAAHLEYLRNSNDVHVISAGPWLDEIGDAVGSFLVVEAEDDSTVIAWLLFDPYNIAGLTNLSKTKIKELGGWRNF